MIPEVPKKKTRPMVLLFLACILLAIVVFGDVLPPGRVLFTTDDNIGVLARSKQALPNKFLGGWASSPLLGKPQEALINWTNLLLWLSPLKLFTNWIHALDLALGSWFLALFLRARGLTWPAVALGTLTGFWLGMTFTLIYSGHLGKFGVVLFAALSLWLTEKAVQKLSMPFASFAGAAWGLMMLEQADVALFFLLALGPYTLHALARDHAGRRRTWARVLIPQVAVSLLVSMPALATGWRHQVAGAAIVQTADADREWNFATEWSWPPEELIDLIAPGYMGWRSHDPSGPYWGRTGRSAGWEETQRGFRNFKLDNNYLGSIPLVFALWACWLAIGKREPSTVQRRDIFFWSLVCLLTLLLSFGKHFFLYQLFYSLPMISSIRNPNKFIQVFQLSVAVLCAYGLHLAGTPANGSRAAGWFGSGTGRKRDLAFLVAIVLGMLALAVTAHLDPIDLAKTLEDDGWGGAAGVIVSTRVSALRHASIMTLVGLIGLGLLLAIRKTSKTRAVPWVLWLILVPVVLDVFLLREHYVETMSVQVLDKPSVTQALQSDRHHRRIALTTRTGFYNHWLTYLFPYHDIDAFNPTQMPRMPKDYGRFLAAMERTPVRMWELSAVGRVLAPTSTWRSMRDSGWSRSFEPVLHYDVAFDPVEPLEVHVTEREGGKHSVLQLKSAAPRYVLVHDWEIVPDNVALRRLSDPQFVPLTKVWVSTDSASDLPKPREVGITSIELATRGPSGETSIRASSDRPAILRIAERYLPGWQVQVDGEPVAPLRCDFLMLGVFLKPGDHEVRLRYRSSSGYLWFQGLGIALVVVGLVAISLPRQRA